MVSRAQLLKRNPAVLAARALIEKNAINPDRLDLDSLQMIANGDKSVQIRAEILVTVPLQDYLDAIEGAQDDLAEAERAAVREAEAQAVADQGQAALEETERDLESRVLAGEDLEPDADISIDGDDGF